MQSTARTRNPAYERADVPVGRVVRLVLGALLAIAVAAVLLDRMLLVFETTETPPGVTSIERRDITPPEPRLEAHPAKTLDAIQARERRLLDTYGWVDRPAGVARIPIDRAMAILADRGWPGPAEGPSAVPAPPDDPASAASGGQP